MEFHEVITTRWDRKEIVPSPVKGVIEEIKVKPEERIDESHTLLTIKKENDGLLDILAGIRGLIHKVNAQVGDTVVIGDVLVFIKEDNFPLRKNPPFRRQTYMR